MTIRLARALILPIVLGATPLFAAAVGVGGRAPDFSLSPAAGGSSVKLSEEIASHRLVVVIFIATRCPFSNGYNERMEALSRKYSARGVAVVGINSNSSESMQEVADHAKKHGFSFAVLKDNGNTVADLYGAQRTPEVFVVDGGGILRYHGRIDENSDDASKVQSPDLQKALDALLAGLPVPNPETKAFGCSIKRQ
jgi:peroxiredoxin